MSMDTQLVEQLLAAQHTFSSKVSGGDTGMRNAYEVGLLRATIRTIAAIHPAVLITLQQELDCLRNQMLCREKLGNTESDGE